MLTNNIYSFDLTSLHHALLIFGREGIGKGEYAEALAARLLCEKPSAQQACGTCEACRWFSAGNHPDYRQITLTTEEETEEPVSSGTKKASPTQIRVEQIRDLRDFVFVGSHRQGRRVILINPADAMNPAASNALLKILEEPPPSVYFLLISSKVRQLLPTLRSRCRQIVLSVPKATDSIGWLIEQGVEDPENLLSFCGGAPLKAKGLFSNGGWEGITQIISSLKAEDRNPLALAGIWETTIKGDDSLGMDRFIETLQKWLNDLIRTSRNLSPRYLPSLAAELRKISSRCSPKRLLRFHQDLLKIRAVAKHPLNSQLFLEDVAARYLQAITPY